MNGFTQYTPSFVDLHGSPEKIPFNSTEELLNIECVKRIVGQKGFSSFAMSRDFLMALFDDGFDWHPIGRVDDPAAINLPLWDGGKYKAQLPNGEVVLLSSKDVVSSCGDTLTLRDGTKAKGLINTTGVE